MKSEEEGRKRSTVRDLLRFIAIALAIAAVIKEMRKPADQRTWHGAILDFVPYDFRKPSMDRVKETMWNPDGPLITPRVFGVGWGVNVGAAVARIKAARAGATAPAEG